MTGLNMRDAVALNILKALPANQKKAVLSKVVEQMKITIPEIEKQMNGLYKVELTVSEEMVITVIMKPTF